MNLKETEILLREMFAIDGRIVDAERIKAWHNVLQNMPLEIAQRGLRLARMEEKIGYIEPKHIIAKARESAEALDREEARKKQQVEMPAQRGVPMPTCIHGVGLLSCDPCCATMARHHKTHAHLEYGDDLCLQFAKENVFA